MKFNKSISIVAICCLALTIVLAARASAQNAEDTTMEPQQQQQGASSDNELNNRIPAEAIGNSSSNCRLFDMFLSPIKKTLFSARRFMGAGMSTVQDGMGRAQMSTYQMFMRLYNKSYSESELPRRMALFFRRRAQIQESVQMFREGKLPFAMKENEFTDWDEDELKKLTGVSLPSRDQMEPDELGAGDDDTEMNVSASRLLDEEDDDDDAANMTVKAESIPAQLDWRNSGCVSKPMNQQKCGACYAIATMSVVESMRCIKKVSSPTLSSQQIVDCSTPRTGYQNFGCNGGWPTRVLKYLQDVKVAAREACYPFKWRQEQCKLSQVSASKGCTVSASPTDNNSLQYKVLHNERDILYHVASTGPVVTVMKASDKFLYYGQGIFDDPRCSNRRDDVDHAIVITGYGRENDQDYWVVKNSWGTSEWGEQGYAKYKRGTNACSVGHWGWAVTG